MMLGRVGLGCSSSIKVRWFWIVPAPVEDGQLGGQLMVELLTEGGKVSRDVVARNCQTGAR